MSAKKKRTARKELLKRTAFLGHVSRLHKYRAATSDATIRLLIRCEHAMEMPTKLASATVHDTINFVDLCSMSTGTHAVRSIHIAV